MDSSNSLLQNEILNESGGDNSPVNEEFLMYLLEMGIPRDKATQALRSTNNASLEEAATCALALNEADNENWEDIDEHFKMVFVVNSSLNMSVGKVAAQVAHAAVGLYRSIFCKAEECAKLACWQDSGEKKVVVRATDEKEMLELVKKSKDHRIPYYSVRDAGLTEIAPNSFTVLSVFGMEEDVDRVTRHLKLL